ncbi:Putative iron transport protein OS=Streptomyces glaucescens OX=1907 GN=SGLAU_24995 PE=3 SV=1 [Streptomyces glaucescens]
MVPGRQGGSGHPDRLRPGAAHDLLQHPDPRIAAESAAVENLLRCWVREADITVPAHGTLRIPLPPAPPHC